MNSPTINVTPLIDVLLVLLIIFMVITPLKPVAFRSKVPAEPTKQEDVDPNPRSIVVRIGADGSLAINNGKNNGTVNDTAPLTEHLQKVFAARLANLSFRENGTDDPAFLYPDKVERTVFIKAPRTIGYGDVARVIDAAKLGGAVPISLQIDSLE